MKKIAIILFSLIISLSLASAIGSLDSARIGKTIYLNETDSAELDIIYSNPSEQIVIVGLEIGEFNEIDGKDSMPPISKINEKNIQLNPGESKISKLLLTELNEGKWEGRVLVTFSEVGGKTKSTLNSVIQLNIIEKESKNIGWIIKISILFLLLIIFFIIKFSISTRKNEYNY